jgi:hypothetical protein
MYQIYDDKTFKIIFFFVIQTLCVSIEKKIHSSYNFEEILVFKDSHPNEIIHNRKLL